MKRLQDLLKNYSVIGLDTSIFIYHLEDHPHYSPLTETIFNTLEKGISKGVTSYLTLIEVLVKPKTEGLLQVARDYEYYLTTFPNQGTHPLTPHLKLATWFGALCIVGIF